MTISRDKLIESAKKLDRQLGNESTFLTKVNEIIIDHSDTNKVADLYKSIYLFQKENKISKISQTLKELSDNLACYLGYSYLFEILGKELGKRNNSSLDELMKELNQLVGLQKVKEEVSRLVIYQKVQSKRKESGLKVPKRTLHMAFMGNPGTGKTTVARIVGRMYYQLGLLSKGHFTEVSRTDLIAGYQGQTALKVKSVIEKAKGGSEENYDELRYEGFGVSGTMVIIDTLTNNVNRTAANLRTAFGKNGGNMGAAGSVSYMFDKKGVIVFAGDDADSIFEQLLEADIDVEDVEAEDGSVTVYTAPTDLHRGIEALRAGGVAEFQVTELEMIPQSEVTLEGEDLETFEKLIDALEDDDDVQKVYHNVDGL